MNTTKKKINKSIINDIYLNSFENKENIAPEEKEKNITFNTLKNKEKIK